ncbi:MAG: Bax inhibitor-1/YccA family protein [Planctomycetaceae bacterium]|nr:Bax inhibitor-1/YccA family protein [Planctomycetaceae bacterium]
MRSGNPALSDATFARLSDQAGVSTNTMTIRGTVAKTMVLLGLCVGSACFTWSMVWSAVQGQAASGTVYPWMIGGLIGGLVFGLATSFVPTWAAVTAPLYALAEGLFLGGLTAVFEMRYPGIAIQGVSATFGTLFALLMAYQSGLIKATENFKLGVFAATGGIGVLYLAGFVLSFFGMSIPFINEPNWFGIGFSAFVVVIAALNLVLDFDFIENAANNGAPKYLEWYGAYGLMVTLVWLYIEILRLLSKIYSSRD